MKKIKILEPKDIVPSRSDFEVVGVFNPGVTMYNNETILLLRVAEAVKTKNGVVGIPVYDTLSRSIAVKEFQKSDPNFDFGDPRIVRCIAGEKNYITSMSHLRVARSRDGINFKVSCEPAITCAGKHQEFGVEDPRITKIGKTYYITYASGSPYGIVTSLSTTEDFRCFEYKGVIFSPDNKDVLLFPEIINGKYYALHRPSTSAFGKPEMWIAESDNGLYWGNHKHIASVRPGYFDSGRIGASCVPFLTDKGWIAIYHGATSDSKYALAVMLLDKNDPSRIIARSEKPLVEPTEEFEKIGFFPNVVFSCGCVQNGEYVDIYYGAADKCVGLAKIKLSEIFENLI